MVDRVSVPSRIAVDIFDGTQWRGTELTVSIAICDGTETRSTSMVDRVSVPSPITIDMLMDTMARDRAHMYLFSV